MSHDFDPATGAYAKPGKPDKQSELRPENKPGDAGHDFDPRTGRYAPVADTQAPTPAKRKR